MLHYDLFHYALTVNDELYNSHHKTLSVSMNDVSVTAMSIYCGVGVDSEIVSSSSPTLFTNCLQYIDTWKPNNLTMNFETVLAFPSKGTIAKVKSGYSKKEPNCNIDIIYKLAFGSSEVGLLSPESNPHFKFPSLYSSINEGDQMFLLSKKFPQQIDSFKIYASIPVCKVFYYYFVFIDFLT